MKKPTQILVPIDFSTCSENALIFALQLADKIKADLLLLNVLTLKGSDLENIAFVPDEIDERRNQSKLRMVKFIQKVTENNPFSLDETPSIQTIIEMGRIEATICDAALKNEVDYIVMGTQGENSTLDKYLGSISSNVLKNSPCPVIVIPENSHFAEKPIIGYATDFSDADPFEIWKAIKLFNLFQPKIKCVHFSGKDLYNKGRIKEFELYFAETAPDLNVEFYNILVEDKVKAMNEFIDEQKINLLVMYKPDRAFFESIFHQSYTQKMAKHTQVPLLVFKNSK
jgi:nucleotide-binding universal stress UspA family protein